MKTPRRYERTPALSSNIGWRNNRFEFSRGRDLVLDPGPSSGPINFLAYPVLEVDGKPEKVKTLFTFTRIRGCK